MFAIFLVPEAPAAAVMYLESLTKYLRSISARTNDETVPVQSPQNYASESDIADLNMAPKFKVKKSVHHHAGFIYTQLSFNY